MAYESTSVPVDKSQAGIRQLLVKHGADQFTFGEGGGDQAWAGIEFVHAGLLVRMRAPLKFDEDRLQAAFAKYQRNNGGKPYGDWRRGSVDQEQRRIWRVLHWTMKARLEAVEEKVETFEQAFLAHIVDPATNRTLYQRLEEPLAAGVFDIGGPGMLELGRGGGT